MLKKLLLIALFFSLIFTATSATFNSIQNGDWNNDNTWDGSGIPNSNGDVIHIYHDVVMTNDINFSFDSLIIYSGGSLVGNYYLMVKANCYLGLYNYLEVCDLEFANGSVIYIDASASLQVNCDFINRNNSDDVEINGTVNVVGNFDNGNGGVVFGTGSITAGTYTGVGTTFGVQPNSSIPPGATVPLPLPIELVKFSAELKYDKTIEINWTTTSETNNDYFSILRSANGRSFETILTTNGAGNSNYSINYSVIDYNPLPGISYYRLKQVDFDGKFELSDIISIDNSTNNIVDNGVIDVYPNPVSHDQDLYLTLNGLGSEKEVLVVVVDILGQELYSKVLFTDLNGESISAIDPHKQLPNGTYIIIGSSDNSVYKKKLIIK